MPGSMENRAFQFNPFQIMSMCKGTRQGYTDFSCTLPRVPYTNRGTRAANVVNKGFQKLKGTQRVYGNGFVCSTGCTTVMAEVQILSFLSKVFPILIPICYNRNWGINLRSDPVDIQSIVKNYGMSRSRSLCTILSDVFIHFLRPFPDILTVILKEMYPGSQLLWNSRFNLLPVNFGYYDC